MNKKQLLIAVDPGFDGAKIIINKKKYHVPFVVEDITGKNSFDLGNDKRLVREYNGRRYLVGEYAKRSYLDNKHLNSADERAKLETFYTIGRFATVEFKIGIETAIAYAMVRYEKETKDEKTPFKISELKDWEIKLSVALPHQMLDELWKESVRNTFVGEHKFTIICENKSIDFDFTLGENDVYKQSQTMAAMFSVVTDDNGNVTADELDKYLPMIVIDAGYKTLGHFKLASDLSVDDGDSNQNFAMYNINEELANDFRKYNPDITSYKIEAYAASRKPRQFMTEDGMKEFNIYELQEEKLKKFCADLVVYLDEKFDKLMNIESIIVAGGTGTRYYKYLLDNFSNRPYIKEKLILAPNGFTGEAEEEPSSLFAVAVGLYKNLILTLSVEEEA